jgi:multiple sugar transport system permease protein
MALRPARSLKCHEVLRFAQDDMGGRQLTVEPHTLQGIRRHRGRRATGRALIYAALLLWAFISLFPIYWTVTTSFKTAVDVTQGHLIPWVDFEPDWRGWRSLGLSPDRIGEVSTARQEFLQRFANSITASVGASLLAIVIGSLAAYGLSRFRYRLGPWRNDDISFFFLSQLILPPVALALPFLVLYRSLAMLDTKLGLIVVYTLMVLPIVIWIMRDQFNAIPLELEQAAQVDGASIWVTFTRIVLPIALPGMVASFILSVVLCWNEYFFAALLTSTDAKTLPVMVASQTGSQGIDWWSMAALSTAAIAPLVLIGIFLERYIVKGLTAGAIK